MDLKLFLILSMALSLLAGCDSNSTDQEQQYIDANKPTRVPQIFAPGFISKDSVAEYGSVFNSSGTEFFFAIDSAGRSFIKTTKVVNGKWIEPIKILFDSSYSYNDPFLSVDERRLYYISDQPTDEQDTISDIDIWYSDREASGWSEPINAGSQINSAFNEYYISFTNDGSMYFSSNKESIPSRRHNFDIYKSAFVGGHYESPIRLSDSINTKGYEADVFIASDESYIIFCSARRSGFGRGDLYISFKNSYGNWTKSISMGNKINTESHELCPYVTADGNFFFYTSNQNIYWVGTQLIDEIRAKAKLEK